MLHDYCGSVLGLAEVLIRSPEPAVSAAASCVYKQAFVTFDTFTRQVGCIDKLLSLFLKALTKSYEILRHAKMNKNYYVSLL